MVIVFALGTRRSGGFAARVERLRTDDRPIELVRRVEIVECE
jgi:hypothetical protein